MKLLNKLMIIISFLLYFCHKEEIKKEKRFEDFELKSECYLKGEKDILNYLWISYYYSDFPLLSFSSDSEPMYFIHQKGGIERVDFDSKDSLIKDDDKIVSIDGCSAQELIYQISKLISPLEIIKLGYISKLDYFLLKQKESIELKTVILERKGKQIRYNFPMKKK